MSRDRRNERPPGRREEDGQYVTVRELDARINTVLNELKWHRWIQGAIVVAVCSPKVGGPSLPQVVGALVAIIPV